MSRAIYWLAGILDKERKCRGFCPACQYYQICKADLELNKGEE